MKKNFTTRLIILSIFFIILSIFLMTLYNIYFLNNFKNELIKKETINYIEKQKNIIETKVKFVSNNIKIKSLQYEKNSKLKIKENVEKAVILVNRIIKKNIELNTMELKKLIKTIYQNYEFSNPNEYYFIIDAKTSKFIVHKNVKMIGTKVNSKLSAQISITDANRGVFKRVKIQKPNINNKIEYEKLIYVKNIKELNWVIGTGIYLEDIKKEAQNLVLQTLKLDKEDLSSYLFIIELYDNNKSGNFGKILIHQGDKKLENEILSYSTNDENMNIYRKNYLNKVRRYGESFIKYEFSKKNNEKKFKKMSFFYLDNSWNWIIGSGFYFEDLTKQITQIKRNINKQMQDYINVALFMSLLLSILTSISFYLFSRKITKTINKYSSDLKSSNNQLEKQKNVFKTLYEKSSDGIILYNEDSKIIDCNASLLNMLNYKNKDNFLGLTNYEISPLTQINSECSFKKWDSFIKTCLEKKSTNFEWILVKKSYEQIWCDITITKIKLNGKTIIHAVIRDISSKKDLEKKEQKQIIALAQQSKKSAMGEMIGNIAHQWRQPLNNVALTMYYLRDNCINLDHEEISKNVENCKIQLAYMSKTIDDFTNYINPNKKLEKFNLQETFAKVFTIVSSQYNDKNIQLNEEIESIELVSFENELMQVIINILNNARDALNTNEEKLIIIKAYKKNNKIIIKIKDNAGGIKPNIMNRIFEPYFTTKKEKEGIGIGLYMVEEMIEKALNGKISVKNVEYKFNNKRQIGALFTITLNT